MSRCVSLMSLHGPHGNWVVVLMRDAASGKISIAIPHRRACEAWGLSWANYVLDKKKSLCDAKMEDWLVEKKFVKTRRHNPLRVYALADFCKLYAKFEDVVADLVAEIALGVTRSGTVVTDANQAILARYCRIYQASKLKKKDAEVLFSIEDDGGEPEEPDAPDEQPEDDLYGDDDDDDDDDDEVVIERPAAAAAAGKLEPFVPRRMKRARECHEHQKEDDAECKLLPPAPLELVDLEREVDGILSELGTHIKSKVRARYEAWKDAYIEEHKAGWERDYIAQREDALKAQWIIDNHADLERDWEAKHGEACKLSYVQQRAAEWQQLAQQAVADYVQLRVCGPK